MLLTDGELQRYADSDPEYNQDLVAIARELMFFRKAILCKEMSVIEKKGNIIFKWMEIEDNATL